MQVNSWVGVAALAVLLGSAIGAYIVGWTEFALLLGGAVMGQQLPQPMRRVYAR